MRSRRSIRRLAGCGGLKKAAPTQFQVGSLSTSVYANNPEGEP